MELLILIEHCMLVIFQDYDPGELVVLDIGKYSQV